MNGKEGKVMNLRRQTRLEQIAKSQKWLRFYAWKKLKGAERWFGDEFGFARVGSKVLMGRPGEDVPELLVSVEGTHGNILQRWTEN